ncbi:MAG: type VI secretion system-associated protein TagF [Alphaproteobacteria bacterium]|nr:type VI secretion system-associated protein TagF [Alphaproteobacteria bacterium]
MSAADTGGPAAAGVAASVAGRVGFFGKLPGRGDFVRRDLPNGFVDVWDNWLQEGIAASRAALGEGWLDAWLCAPIWRFALPAGMCGADAWAGVMMPSVDRAGRYFPLTLATLAPQGVPPAAMLSSSWIAAVEAVALSALGEDTDFDRFAEAVAGLPAYAAVRAESWAGGWRARAAAGDPAAISVAFAAAGASAALSTYCVFATNGGGRVMPAAWVLPHLPPHRMFVGLIDDLDSGVAPAAAVDVPAGMAVPLWIGGVAPVPALPTADTELGHAASLFGSEFATDAPPTLQGEPPGGAFDRMFDEQAAPPPPAPMPAEPGAAIFEQTEPAAEPPTPEQAAPATLASDVRTVRADLDAPGSTWEVAENDKETPLSPKDLFGDTVDDVPPAPGGLFDHKDDNGQTS